LVRTVKNTSHRRCELLGLKPRGEYGELLVKQLGWRLCRDDVKAGRCKPLKNSLCGMLGDVIEHLLVLADLCESGRRHVNGRTDGDMGCANGDHQPPDRQPSTQATVMSSIVIAVEKFARLERKHSL
jgi:hypothetical protein